MKNSKWKVALISVGVFVLAIIVLSSLTSTVAEKELNHIENQVAEDAVKQYEIAKKNGDKMQTYVQASMVTQAYLQANDEENYKKWKEIEKKEAKEAGMPDM